MCEVGIDDCQDNPCSNGGECIDGNNDFDCVCGQGFTGKKCQHKIDYCIDDPCQNGGTCSSKLSLLLFLKYLLCQLFVYIIFCLHFCIDTATGYECECRPGYDGLTCGLDIDECINRFVCFVYFFSRRQLFVYIF